MERSRLLIIENQVYDVSSFRDRLFQFPGTIAFGYNYPRLSNYSINHRHPGGASVLDKFAGLDATHDFQAVGHSLHAMNILATLLVAQIEDPGFQIALIPLSI